MTLAPSPVYQEVYQFLASRPTHEEILAFRPTEATQTRIHQLLAANKEGRLAADEQNELDEFETVEHFVRMLKLHTRQIIEQK
jgi:hypothetical protein